MLRFTTSTTHTLSSCLVSIGQFFLLKNSEMRAFELVPTNGTAFLSMHADGPPSKWVDKQSLISQCLMAAVILTMLNFLLCRLTEYKDGLPVVGRSFVLEPSLITRIRFAFNSRQILNAAYKKVGTHSRTPSDVEVYGQVSKYSNLPILLVQWKSVSRRSRRHRFRGVASGIGQRTQSITPNGS